MSALSVGRPAQNGSNFEPCLRIATWSTYINGQRQKQAPILENKNWAYKTHSWYDNLLPTGLGQARRNATKARSAILTSTVGIPREPSHQRRGSDQSSSVSADMVQTEEWMQQMRLQDAANQKHPLVDACAQLLDATVAHNDTLNRASISEMSIFDGAKPTPVTPDAYVRRIMKYGGCNPSCLVLGMVYLERVKKRVHKVWLTSKNVQRLFLVAVMEASKFNEDFYYSNRHWADIGGLSLKELNKMEIAFLTLVNFDFYVSKEDYQAFSSAVLEWVPQSKHTSSTPEPASPPNETIADRKIEKESQDKSLANQKSPSYTDVTCALEGFA